jgi:hypothetical protein
MPKVLALILYLCDFSIYQITSKKNKRHNLLFIEKSKKPYKLTTYQFASE